MKKWPSKPIRITYKKWYGYFQLHDDRGRAKRFQIPVSGVQWKVFRAIYIKIILGHTVGDFLFIEIKATENW